MSPREDALRGSHDHVLVTAPPLRSAGDAAVLGRLGAGLVLVARYDRTRPARLADAADAVAEAGGRLLGVVLTHVPPSAGVVRSQGHRYRADEDRGGAVAVRRAVLSTRSRRRAHV